MKHTESEVSGLTRASGSLAEKNSRGLGLSHFVFVGLRGTPTAALASRGAAGGAAQVPEHAPVVSRGDGWVPAASRKCVPSDPWAWPVPGLRVSWPPAAGLALLPGLPCLPWWTPENQDLGRPCLSRRWAWSLPPSDTDFAPLLGEPTEISVQGPCLQGPGLRGTPWNRAAQGR